MFTYEYSTVYYSYERTVEAAEEEAAAAQAYLRGDEFALGVGAAAEADNELRAALADAAAELECRRVLVLVQQRLDALHQSTRDS